MSRIVAIQPDLLGGPDVEGHAYEVEVYVWDWCGILFPPNADQIRQYRMQRADTLTPDEATALDQLAARSRCAPLDRLFEREQRHRLTTLAKASVAVATQGEAA